MGRGGHGSGQSGTGHSHDPENPDDDWNLYCHLDPEGSTALNVKGSVQAIEIFKVC